MASFIYSFQSIFVLVIYVTNHPKQMKEMTDNRVGCLRSALLLQSQFAELLS